MPADVYSLTIVDDNGCIQTFPNLLAITEPPAISMTVDGSTDVSCFGGNDGEILITPSGGTPPYSFQWLGTFTSHSSSAEDPDDLPADTYSLTITDDNSCFVTYPDLVIIGEPAQLDVSVDLVVHVDCNGASTGSIDRPAIRLARRVASSRWVLTRAVIPSTGVYTPSAPGPLPWNSVNPPLEDTGTHVSDT